MPLIRSSVGTRCARHSLTLQWTYGVWKLRVWPTVLLPMVLLLIAHREIVEGHVGHYSCGVGLKDLKQRSQYSRAARQLYSLSRRQLSDQEYGADESSGSDTTEDFQTASDAEREGLTGPLRLKMRFDLFELGGSIGQGLDNGGDSYMRHMCTAEAQVIELWNGGTYTCAIEDIVDGKVAGVVKARMEWTVEWAKRGLRLRQVKDDIVAPIDTLNNFRLEGFAGNQVSSGSDLVIFVSIRPFTVDGVAAYAECLQKDQFSRCTVGHISWVPAALGAYADDYNERDAAATMAERHTALHEVLHLLGAIGIDVDVAEDTAFRNVDGSPNTDGVFEVRPDSAYGKPTTYIKTDLVAKVASEQFGCIEFPGIPLEDSPLGAGSHWEARIMGPEVMSYGFGSGESYVSDLTLAYLEDTKQYIANYSNAGPVFVDAEVERETGGIDLFTKDKQVDETVDKYDYGPGHIRWGRNLGCTFLNKPASEWPNHYTCQHMAERSCSPDNRMAAVCNLHDWDEVVPRDYSYGDRASGRATVGATNDNCNEENSACGIPTTLQYFDSDEAATTALGSPTTKGRLGGWSLSMDFVPVRLGYRVCTHSAQSAGASRTGQESGMSIREIFFTDNAEYGGQNHCPSCRCFASSLRPITRAVDFSFPISGACYTANCYRKDYLQVGVIGQFGDNIWWYKCPLEGGKLYIPGFTGALHCPPAERFCEMESITGTKHAETNPMVEWIFWGIIIGLPLLILLPCFVRCYRRRSVNFLKRCCGVRIFDVDRVRGQRKKTKAGRTVVIFASIILLLGAGFLALAIYALAVGFFSSAALPLLTIGVSAIFGGIAGIRGACSKGRSTSCMTITFFIMALMASLLIVFAVGYAFVVAGSLAVYVDRYWDTFYDLFQYSLDTTASRAEQMEEARAIVESNIVAIAAALSIILVILILAMVASGILITRRVLAATVFCVLHWLAFLIAVGMLGMTIYLSVVLHDFDELLGVILVGIFSTGIFLLTAFFALYAIITVKMWPAKPYFVFALLSTSMSFVGIFFTLIRTEATKQAFLAEEDAFSRLVDRLGLSFSEDELSEYVSDILRGLGIFFVIVFVCLICLIFIAVYVFTQLNALKKSKRKEIMALAELQTL